MHILHVIDSLAIGGAERMLVDIANTSVYDGYQVSVCITRSQIDLASELHPQINVITLNRTRRFDMYALNKFSDLVKDVDIVHVHGRSSFSFVAIAKTLHSNTIPLVLHDHYGSIEIDRHIPLWFRLWGRHMVSAYIGVYENLATWAFQAGIPKKKIFVIGNGINISRIQTDKIVYLREEFGIDISSLLGVVVAGLRREKGIDLLIKSIGSIEQQKQNFRIIVIGGERDPKYVQECKELAQLNGIADYLVFGGERTNIPQILNCVDFALIPSRSESGPLVLIEYLAASLPFVAFNVGDIAQRSSNYGIPGFVKAEDITAFAEEFSLLLSLSSEERCRRGAVGRVAAEKLFSIQLKMPQIYEVYRRVQTNL
jgi:glycosyltransferase involved in cell wall biosynthesis